MIAEGAITMQGLLPPYTLEERSRELCMSSKALCWRARRAQAQSRRLQDENRALRLISEKRQGAANHPPACQESSSTIFSTEIEPGVIDAVHGVMLQSAAGPRPEHAAAGSNGAASSALIAGP